MGLRNCNINCIHFIKTVQMNVENEKTETDEDEDYTVLEPSAVVNTENMKTDFASELARKLGLPIRY